MNIKLFLLVALLTFRNITSQEFGSWIEIDSLNEARVGHASVVLPNGNILVSGNGVDSASSSCEIYEIKTGYWRYTNPMNVPRHDHSLVLLQTGLVLAIGGYQEKSCELFNPVTEKWELTDSLQTIRSWGHTVTKLLDGSILVSGGFFMDTNLWEGFVLNNCEIYNPESGTWYAIGSLNIERKNHSATILNDGRILVAGGSNNSDILSSCEIYDPSTNTWNIIPTLNEKRYSHSSIKLKNGKVFISGGIDFVDSIGIIEKRSCEVFDPDEFNWNIVSGLSLPRSNHSSFYTSDSTRLLILGGSDNSTWEIYDPVQFSSLFSESFIRRKFLENNSVQLGNDVILVIGSSEYDFATRGLPYSWSSKTCERFESLTNIDNERLLGNYFSISQNYPNPFNPVTSINYSISANNTQVRLIIYDVLGREVKTLINETKNTGRYNIQFDGGNLPSGVYYYTLFAGTKTKTKAMVLIK